MKEKNHTLSSSITRLNILAQRMEQNEDNIPAIELDLFLQELRNLYGIALEMAIPATAATTTTNPKVVEESPNTVVAPEPKTEAVPEVIELEPVKEEPTTIIPEVAAAAATETVVETILAKETPEQPPFAPAEAEETLSEIVTANEMENIEGTKNDELFFGDEESETPQQEEVPSQTEMSINDIPAEPEPAQIQEPAQVEISEPIQHIQVEEKKPEPEPVPTKQPEPEPKTTQSNNQSSLLSYLKHAAIDNTPQSSAPRTIGESLHPYSYNIEEQLASRVNSQKVDDLRTIININDKFSFINELFHNNMKGYNDFILHLNSLQLREEALEYVGAISQMNHWDENSLAVKTFFSLFDRKF